MKQKQNIAAALAILIVCGPGFHLLGTDDGFVPLYPIKLAERDIKEVSEALTELGIPHRVEVDQGIFVHPDTKSIFQQKAISTTIQNRQLVSS